MVTDRAAVQAERTERSNQQRRELDARIAFLTAARKSNTPVPLVDSTAFGIVEPGRPLPAGVPANFVVKQEAMHAISERRAIEPDDPETKRGNFRGEAAYRAYYDDLVADRASWMRFFDHPLNMDHACNTCCILGTLATIYRQRGLADDCEMVLDLEADVLGRYRRAVAVPGCEAGAVQVSDGVRYKYNMLRYNVRVHAGRYEDCVRFWRELAAHELEYCFSDDDQMFLYMLEVLGKEKTRGVLKKLTDAEVLRAIEGILGQDAEAIIAHHGALESSRVQLKACSKCAKIEPHPSSTTTAGVRMWSIAPRRVTKATGDTTNGRVNKGGR